MSFCVNCGVELDDGIEICPLCGNYPGKKGESENPSFSYPSDIIQLHRKENRKYLWELSGIIAFSGVAVCTIVDLSINRGLGWSLVSDASVLATWVIITLFLYARKRVSIVVPCLALTILAYLFIIDLVVAGKSWFIPVALPLAITASVSAVIVIILYRIANFKGLNIIATAFILISGFCILTETILDKYLNNVVELRWSLITAVSLLPVTLIFIFYYYRLNRGSRIDSFFHV